jgi:Mn2+/Fe2+ NRAMP family transporter
MSSTALPLHAMFPAVPFNAWAVLSGIAGLVLVMFNRYDVFEKITAVLVAVMFVTVVSAAALATPNLPDLLAGLVPVLPSGGLFYSLGLIGGVGGTITMAAYGYWVHAKGWRDAAWMKVMRLDNSIAYVMTGIFVVAMMIVGAELLYSTNRALEGDGSLLTVGTELGDQYGQVMRWSFLVGFWATSFTSIIGVWNGVSLLFADFAASVQSRIRGSDLPDVDDRASMTSPWFRGYILWLTFPPMLLLLLGEPVQLIVLYGALGAAFMPVLAGTLLWLMNSERVPAEHRNGWLSNTTLTAAGLLFFVLCINELVGLV